MLIHWPSPGDVLPVAVNLEAVRLRLTDDDQARIAALDRGERLANPDFAPRWD